MELSIKQVPQQSVEIIEKLKKAYSITTNSKLVLFVLKEFESISNDKLLLQKEIEQIRKDIKEKQDLLSEIARLELLKKQLLNKI